MIDVIAFNNVNLDQTSWAVYNVNGINSKKGKGSKRDFSTEWISSCLDFRQTDLNQCSALTYKSLSECRQLKDVWQVNLKCCVSSGIQTTILPCHHMGYET